MITLWFVILKHFKVDFYGSPFHASRIHVNKYIGESRQPQAIFQFPFFFGKSTIKNQKTNIVALEYNYLARL